jgi:hypothetical protein
MSSAAGLSRPSPPRTSNASRDEPVRAGTVQAFQSETHSEINELENSVNRLETQLMAVMSAPPPTANSEDAKSVGGACDVAQSAHSAAMRIAGIRERIEAVLCRLQIA